VALFNYLHYYSHHHQKQQQQLHGLGLIDLFSLHLRNIFQRRTWDWGHMVRATRAVDSKTKKRGQQTKYFK
jgi:hypothetical protein